MGTWQAKDFKKHNIFHLAGVTDDKNGTVFYKSKYQGNDVIKLLKKDIDYFNKIDINHITYMYIQIAKECVKKILHI